MAQPTPKLAAYAKFACGRGESDLSPARRERFKIHLLDTIGCAIAAQSGAPARESRSVVQALGGTPECTLVGGGKTSLPHAAYYNGVLVRYLDFMDAILGKKGESHPSDNLASLLAAAERENRSGGDLLLALAVSYQIQGRLTQETSIMERGFDHTTTLTLSIAAGVGRLLELCDEEMLHALAVAGSDAPGVFAVRSEPLSNMKGMASAFCAYRATFAVLLAQSGVRGPEELFEGPGGLIALTDDPWDVDWNREGLDVIDATLIKKHNAEARSQSTLDLIGRLRSEHQIRPADVERVEIISFKSAYDNLGGGKFGPKIEARRKEQADHNLRYMTAAMLLDGEVMPEQFLPERIAKADVQGLMQRVVMRPDPEMSRQDPDLQPTRVTILLRDGHEITGEAQDYDGFPTRPAPWSQVQAKFERLTTPYADAALRREITQAVQGIEAIPVRDLTALLARASA